MNQTQFVVRRFPNTTPHACRHHPVIAPHGQPCVPPFCVAQVPSGTGPPYYRDFANTTQWDSSGRVINPTRRHTALTRDRHHGPGGIRTCNFSKRVAADRAATGIGRAHLYRRYRRRQFGCTNQFAICRTLRLSAETLTYILRLKHSFKLSASLLYRPTRINMAATGRCTSAPPTPFKCWICFSFISLLYSGMPKRGCGIRVEMALQI
jgi:hypothetical protein